MIQRLLFYLMILFTYNIWAQSPPPPCGLSPSYVCDINGDGIEEFNLDVLYPFNFCIAPSLNQEDYHPTAYYESEEDARNAVNPIATPSMYLSNSYFQTIYFRAEKILPDGSNDVLYDYDYLYIIPLTTPNTPTPLTNCDTNGNGISIFNLTDKNEEILAGLNNNEYIISYFESYTDAENSINEINDESYTNTTPYSQTIYAEVQYQNSSGCDAIVELDLIVFEVCDDLGVYLTYYGAPPRPGFNFINRLYLKNEGTMIINSGTVEYSYDGLLEFNNTFNVNPNYTITLTSNGFTVDFVNLLPNETELIEISMYCPATVNIGELITNSVVYTTNSDDVLELNDESFLTQTVVGSYDPNDVIESHGPTILFEDFTIDDYLFYTVRFQNIGTAEAIDVRIENVLDSKLDESTFQILSSSHSNSLNRVGNQLVWTFNNIGLPSESMDESNSHGFVYYKIKPSTGYGVENIIPNSADIYFDFNSAVETNTFETEFVIAIVLSEESNSISKFSIFPNPASNVVNIKFINTLGEDLTVTVYDIQGKLVLIEKISNSTEAQLDMSQLEGGFYFVKLKTGDQETIKKLILK
ncbi:MAG: T9SS type A sorting domain-containing protein [Flavobacteriaceae bacterium]